MSPKLCSNLFNIYCCAMEFADTSWLQSLMPATILSRVFFVWLEQELSRKRSIAELYKTPLLECRDIVVAGTSAVPVPSSVFSPSQLALAALLLIAVFLGSVLKHEQALLILQVLVNPPSFCANEHLNGCHYDLFSETDFDLLHVLCCDVHKVAAVTEGFDAKQLLAVLC